MKVLKEITHMNITGNVTPLSWFQNIGEKKKSGFKANQLAINILAEVIYWYRLTEVRSETTGLVVEYKKKFKADKLQVRYQALADKFGSTKIVAKRACDVLVKLKLVTREFRHFKTESGMQLSNVMYLQPIPENIKEITNKLISPLRKSKDLLTEKSGHINKNDDTYTETTTEITTDTLFDSKESNVPLNGKKINGIKKKKVSPIEHTEILKLKELVYVYLKQDIRFRVKDCGPLFGIIKIESMERIEKAFKQAAEEKITYTVRSVLYKPSNIAMLSAKYDEENPEVEQTPATIQMSDIEKRNRAERLKQVQAV